MKRALETAIGVWLIFVASWMYVRVTHAQQKPPLSTSDCDNPLNVRVTVNCPVPAAEQTLQTIYGPRLASSCTTENPCQMGYPAGRQDPCEPLYEAEKKASISSVSAGNDHYAMKLDHQSEVTMYSTMYLACREHEK